MATGQEIDALMRNALISMQTARDRLVAARALNPHSTHGVKIHVAEAAEEAAKAALQIADIAVKFEENEERYGTQR